MTLSTTKTVVRGATVQFSTTFYAVDGVTVIQPGGATVNIVFVNPDGSEGTASIAMTAPVSPAVAWTAQWDSRDANPGAVAWSIHTDPGPPFAVEDGNFTLTANAANLLTFT